MNQIKPYLFWVVLGVILFIELMWWVLSIPDLDVLGNKADAQKTKKTLDTEYQNLEKLDKKAKNGSPTGVFDAEKDADIRNLTDNYLITPDWKKILDPHVKRYDEQLLAIKNHLASRSKNLRKPIAESTNTFAWYTAYQNATEGQLKQLFEANALVMPSVGKTSAKTTATNLPGGQPTSVSTAPTTTSTGPDFGSDASLRALAGFFTKGSDLPEADQHAQLTKQFRTMERIISVVVATTATDLPNPLAGVEETPVASRVAIGGVTWANQTTETAEIGGDTGRYATGWQLTLTVQGPLSSILSVMTSLEHPHEPTNPLMKVVGIQITRKPIFVAGERKDTGSESVVARIDLVVLDFTDAPAGSKAPAAPQRTNGRMPGGTQPGMPPGMMPPGMQGGMPPGMGGPPAARPPGGSTPSNREANE